MESRDLDDFIPRKTGYHRLGRLKLNRKLIEMAMANTLSNKEASRFLGVAYHTYKKYASKFVDEETGQTLFEKHYNEYGSNRYIPNYKHRNSPVKVEDVLSGENKTYSRKKLIQRLISESYLEGCCSACGFDEKRVDTGEVPLILEFKDENWNNLNLSNLYLLCHNCHQLYLPELRTSTEFKKHGLLE